MLRKQISAMLVCLMFATFTAPFALGQNDKNTVAIKAKVARYSTNKKKGVKIKTHDGKKMKGYVSRMGTDDFDLTDPSGRVSTFEYREVSSVSRLGVPTKALVGVAIGVGGFILLSLIVATYCRSNNCPNY